MKSANWISAIGMRPLSAAPIAMPTMPDSASGMSRTRASPNFAYSPSVAPKTPPLRPTSSPMTSTRSSRSISSVMAARTASIIRISATLFIPRPHIVHRRSDGARAFAPDLLVHGFIQDACGHQPTAHAVDRLGGEPVALGSGGRRCVVMLGIRESAREVLDQADERQRVGAREVDVLVPVAGDSNRKIHLFETAQHLQAAFDGAGHDHRVIEREKSVWLKIGTGSARRHRLSRLHLWGGRGQEKCPGCRAPTLGGSWHFVLGRCQERDGRVSAGQALLPAE